MKTNKALNAWSDINSLLQTHKMINLGALIVCLIQMFVIVGLAFQNPVVIDRGEGQQEYFNSNRNHSPIDESAVKSFVKKFLETRYEWDKLDPDSKYKSMAPLVTKGLNKKLLKVLTDLHQKEFQGKVTSQSIVNVNIAVTDESVTATFDKLLKIEGIPIPVPTSVALQIDKGSSNRWNPIGLYVNAIKEHQSK